MSASPFDVAARGYAPAVGTADPVRRPGRRWRGPVVAVVALLAVVELGAAVAVVAVPLVVAGQATAGPCGAETAGPGASADAVAYVDAANRTAPSWQALSDKIAAAGMVMDDGDLVVALQLDDLFLADLREIDFAPAARPAADRMITAVEDYQAFVQRSLDEPGYLSAHRDEDAAVNQERAVAGALLRDQLGLAPTECVLNRP